MSSSGFGISLVYCLGIWVVPLQFIMNLRLLMKKN
jgi:hypothetical protein